ncbi:enoyl-CoA hydratase/isomerase family protein [Cupriavidus nantongensis]|uniref:enoyl-CoA hydratase/isomerase family protein n=1 Tax=Cupriavidus nantongensis TaxID=1796606 RepID=UPI00358F6E8D
MEAVEAAVVKAEIRHGILMLGIDNPPVNALNNRVRQALFDHVATAQSDDAVHAMVIYGCRARFSAGADIREFNGTRRSPFTSEVAGSIEEGKKPAVAALSGYALGGGLELALGTHARVAAKSARFALPEVKLGLLPGGGGTQRLPRLIGVENAVDMILSGREIASGYAFEVGLVDKVVEDEALLSEAFTMARMLAGSNVQLRRTGRLRADAREGLEDLVAAARAQLIDEGEIGPAHEFILSLVSAATKLPLADGIKAEHEAFMRCVETAEHKNLAERFFVGRVDGARNASM